MRRDEGFVLPERPNAEVFMHITSVETAASFRRLFDDGSVDGLFRGVHRTATPRRRHLDPDGLPLALHLVGRPWDEQGVLDAAMQFQRETGWHSRRPPYPWRA